MINGYIFLCSNSTEKECLDKNLFGGTERYQTQIKEVKKGDYLFLYNYTKNKMHGIFLATSEAKMNIDPGAWGGNFPWQVKAEISEEHEPLYRLEFESFLSFGKDQKHPAAKLKDIELENLLVKFRSKERLLEGDVTFVSKNPAHFRTEDGHLVRSKGEVEIDNYLYKNKIPHAYEKLVPTNEPMLCDFFIPSKDLYIEYWGLEDEKYLMRKKDKLKIYKGNKLNLLEITPEEIKNLETIISKRIVGRT